MNTVNALIEYAWPDDFIDGIPPKTSAPAQGKVFRLVDTIPPIESDFRQTREENPNRTYNTIEAKRMPFGVSFWADIEELKKKQHKYRKALGKKKVVSGVLVPELGFATDPDKISHRTLWKQIGSEPHLHINVEER
jgi:hypothetical protein